MTNKLLSIAKTFVHEVGNKLPHYTFVFPNHRAGLFFQKYLAQHVQQPIFAPQIQTINECFAELSDLQATDQLTLLLRLYSEYTLLRPEAESLEEFLYWGKMMISDFSEIDNHLVPHVEALFASIKDLHDIDERFSYLTDNQRETLSHFWNKYHNSENNHPNGSLHHSFLHTWDLLFSLYTALRNNLQQDGLAYEGMLHRQVIDNWEDIPAERFRQEYVFIGFNALTTSERELMLRLQEMNKADFYFDYDATYLCDPQNKASLFMEENLQLFHSRYSIPEQQSSSATLPSILLSSVPSSVEEVHEVHRILSDIIPSTSADLTRTAIVLPDEQLLIPLLHALPKSIDKINVTMGYPIRVTSLYMPIAYPELHLPIEPTTPTEFIQLMREYLQTQLHDETSEAIYQLTKVLDRLETALHTYSEIAFSVADMQQLLKMLTMEATIPYIGEPLDGLQVMGVLETRALDFDNVIITDFNDDKYPGHTHTNSFIPYTLRNGFGLPTLERQNAIFSYNFYRMLSHAKNVWFITNSTADEQHSGEISRYFYQLKWQYNINIKEVIVTNRLSGTLQTTNVPIIKDQRIHQLQVLSPSALTTYLRCPKQFYYKHIEHIKQPDIDETISVSDATLGDVLHMIMQHLYAPNTNITASTITRLLEQVNDDTYWSSLSPLESLQGDTLAECVVRTYVNNILNYDYTYTPFQFLHAEKEVSVRLAKYNILLKGTIDRIDCKSNITRVIDYKTGKTDLEYTSMQDVFGITPHSDTTGYIPRKKGKSHILQTMLYCWILSEQYPNLTPHIYATRRLSDATTCSHVYTKGTETPVTFDEQIKKEFANELDLLISEILNPDIPFHPTEDSHSCEYCPFALLCRK